MPETVQIYQCLMCESYFKGSRGCPECGAVSAYELTPEQVEQEFGVRHLKGQK